MVIIIIYQCSRNRLQKRTIIIVYLIPVLKQRIKTMKKVVDFTLIILFTQMIIPVRRYRNNTIRFISFKPRRARTYNLLYHLRKQSAWGLPTLDNIYFPASSRTSEYVTLPRGIVEQQYTYSISILYVQAVCSVLESISGSAQRAVRTHSRGGAAGPLYTHLNTHWHRVCFGKNRVSQSFKCSQVSYFMFNDFTFCN